MGKYLDINGLEKLWGKIKHINDNKVNKELKTGSKNEYKVLSDNNLTDALVLKIKNAGSGTFTGSYEDLTDVPEKFPPMEHIHTVDQVSGINDFFKESIGTATKNFVTGDEMKSQLAKKSDVTSVSDLQSRISTAESAIRKINNVEHFDLISNPNVAWLVDKPLDGTAVICKYGQYATGFLYFQLALTADKPLQILKLPSSLSAYRSVYFDGQVILAGSATGGLITGAIVSGNILQLTSNVNLSAHGPSYLRVNFNYITKN